MSQSLLNCSLINQMCTEVLEIKFEVHCHFHQTLLPAIFNKTQGEEECIRLGVRCDVKLKGLMW